MLTPFEAAIDALVASVDAAWGAAGRDFDALPGVAAACLADCDLRALASVDALCEHVASTARLAPQLDPASQFGEPPVTLAVADGFHVDAYLWVRPATLVHDHGFCGAFCVAEGVSLLTRFAFESSDPAGAPVRRGDLRAAQPELLGRGAVREVWAGAVDVHQVAHLSYPSLSLLVRSTSARLAAPTYHYLGGFAVAGPSYLEPAMWRKLELAGWSVRMQRPNARRDLLALAATCDELALAWLLRVLVHQCLQADLAAEVAAATDVAWAPAFVDALGASGQGPTLAFADDEVTRMYLVMQQNGFSAEACGALAPRLEALARDARP
jgi:hypothetical protein